MRFYSIIIPVYNRPEEIKELLESLTLQTYRNFEVVIVEDGSAQSAELIVKSFQDRLTIQYFYKENTGQGLSRNYAYARAKGDYFIVFDSDCLIPPQYLQAVENRLNTNYLDAFGGPDRADVSFTPVQKAISYSMTSLFTTGGIRGNKKGVGVFHPRSFNMGISREVWERTQGYIITRMGEDIEFSIRIMSYGFTVGLIEEAYVFHKRRTNFKQFFKQVHFFGRARINIFRFVPSELKLTHFFPMCFVLFSSISVLLGILNVPIGALLCFLLYCYTGAIFIDASLKNSSIKIGLLSVAAAYTQLWGYGIGFMKEGITELFSPTRKKLKELLIRKKEDAAAHNAMH
ncbi:glycosyltransferase [Cytophaga hutchinsonii]|uniref:B-glycosyltransferase, glycosyltransferase family 2 protein n=1 Tax=Cytophaga hutchinsonii (strain ATCC 33406 / DSM 1761 / CIP 103989 / NBRC 15051 / NCIMB 9469 / D465) TaxID=269798 RepID=A0A6N4SS00_CYTH3|nr:glycosyltransferase [Cytophaga hutchinsonii]ABG59058.1 b-glycosyltransferase, glycosyltransferase family 2 protein [Cytophaga hutchinsonii ATCC 33406]SFX37945.1 Glycosyltransferase, catalytic subunit of cellulose synthase and poly-beta-1,6-N-acetylglucosamine synthase [Cytophaga hutchinsonii ATCC 33406]